MQTFNENVRSEARCFGAEAEADVKDFRVCSDRCRPSTGRE